MIQKIRKSKASKVIACYLALMIILEIVAPMQAYALTGGPSQPEFESFTPIGTSDMVDLSSGDFNYNIPIMDVGGYPINLAYNSGIGMDQEASWVGLGWDLNAGQITRQLRGLPDDFDGDEMLYENHMKDNVTVGGSFNAFGTLLAITEYEGDECSGIIDSLKTPKLNYNAGFGLKYNNYDGFVFSLSGGLTYQISQNLAVGMNMNSSATDGVSASPSVSFSAKATKDINNNTSLTGNVGTTLNNRQGIENVSLSGGMSKVDDYGHKNGYKIVKESHNNSTGGSISFADNTFTPTKRVGMTSSNFIFNMNIEGEFWGIEPGLKFSGYRTSQGIKESEKKKKEKAYGFENSYNATDRDVLDFNREKDRTFGAFTTSLPVTNNTYDVYSINGQGVSGMFRPYKSQVAYVYDNFVNDDSSGGDLGIELGAGGGAHWGVDIKMTNANSYTKVWRDQNKAISRLEEKKTGNRPDYEKVFFKNIGGFHVDSEADLLDSRLGGYDPVRVSIGGSRYAPTLEQSFDRKGTPGTIAIGSALKREKRLSRNQAIQKITAAEAMKYGSDSLVSKYARNNHTAEMRIIKDGGERYVYGKAAYNTLKKETTFAVNGRVGNCSDGLVPYNPGTENSINNRTKGDQYFNRITTPAYAHSYLLTAVLSSDFSDLTNNGPSDDDLGSYTKFEYDSKTKDKTYKWRVPYAKNKANYDEGLKSSDRDDKGNYIYGEKEILYIKKIETKTHVAIFDISLRKDGYGVDDENGGGTKATSSRMYKLNKISLYSKPEYKALGENATPIKVAHFEYDYSLCKGVDNNFKEAVTPNDPYEKSNDGGKLTLKKIYFTYGKSNMGKYTPYVFHYNSGDMNPNYNMKNYDIWGNYKPSPANAGCEIGDAMSNAEFAYVDQNKENADKYSSAWHLVSIDLPSGGTIEMDYESDDYRYVQDKEAMQMFQVAGVGNNETPGTLQEVTNNTLYGGGSQKNRLYVKLPGNMSDSEFKDRYIKNLEDETVYFRFLLNMAKPGSGNDRRYDYVTGYLTLQKNATYRVFSVGSDYYASIPINSIHKGDGFNSNDNVNPIAKAGWLFGRQYLNRFVYGDAPDESTDDLEEIVMEILGSLPHMADIVKSPNGQLMDNKIASTFIKGKSFVRLMCPNKAKYGGGSRVKEIRMHDQWDVMTNHTGNDDYSQYYGQQYSYGEKDLSTSDPNDMISYGVAAYEPIGCKENPFVQPFYDKHDPGKVLGPDNDNYIEKPFGESFFPSPRITYAKVLVKNLPRKRQGSNGELEVKKHATGVVATEFFTSRDYPTIVDYTDMKMNHDNASVLANLLNLSVRDYLTLSQGFSIHTNDMDGKMKSQRVYAEGQGIAISGVDYLYDDLTTQGQTNFNKNTGKLDNSIITVDAAGKISKKLVGVDYDVINDFRHNKSETTTAGISINTAFLPITLVVLTIPTPLPSLSFHDNQIRTAVTTKVIHSSGILRGQRVFDAGSSVTTKNLAWDAETGNVLLTETVNEYDDKYYSFNFPAYWIYKGMGQTARNIGMTSTLKPVVGAEGQYQFSSALYKASDYLNEGDELWIETGENEFKAYIANVEDAKFKLITSKGLLVTPEMLKEGKFTIIRSGFRNMQEASMASMTTMVNPLYNGANLRSVWPNESEVGFSWANYKVLNASAIEYNDTWAAQCECRLPRMKYEGDKLVFDYSNDNINKSKAYNPFIYNIKGNWRPKVSYAFLTARNTYSISTRGSGFFDTFNPYYTYNTASAKWVVNTAYLNTPYLNKWTYASEVSQYNPFGFEVENKDALGRYSSAMYGYNYRFPVAVASNTRYKELAYDGFEDYDFSTCDTTAHFNFKGSIEHNKVTISSSQAHSGRKSLKVAPKKKATIKKQIVPCTTTSN